MVSFKFLTTALLATTAVALPHANTHAHTHKRTSTSKRGACYNDPSLVQSLSDTGSISWAYDWNMYIMGTLPSGVEFVPMLWGSKMFGGWISAIQTALSSGSSYILGFNEPDMASQASMSSSDAANYYRQYITPYSGQAKLVTPAITNGHGTDVGLDWMRNFLTQCSDCGLSVMAVHWYGDYYSDFENFVNEATALASEFNLESTWVTEFALNSDLSGSGATTSSVDFLNEALPFLDSNTAVGRYSYFMTASGYLLDGSSLSMSGSRYTS